MKNAIQCTGARMPGAWGWVKCQCAPVCSRQMREPEDRATIQPVGRDFLRISFRLDFEEGRALAALAADNDRTLSAELRRAVKLYLRASAAQKARQTTAQPST